MYWRKANRAPDGSLIDDTVHPDDEMFAFICQIDPEHPLVHYLESGRSMVDAFSDALGCVDRTIDGPLLEFACGHGRGTRQLVHRVESLTVADIHPGAVGHVTRSYGVDGFVSVTDPDELQHAGSYRTILVASLFSHLPHDRWCAWLETLSDLLAPDGRLVVSTNGPDALDRLPSRDHLAEVAPGFWFGPDNETDGRLASTEYGTTYVSEEFVRHAGDVLHRAPAGLWDTQDLYVLARRDPSR